MIITEQVKKNTVDALLADMGDRAYKSQNEYSKYIRSILGIPFDKAAFSQIKKVEGYNALKDSSWLILAKHFNVLGDNVWQTAETHAYLTMHTYLNSSKRNGLFRILCDHASYGKTYSANIFAQNNKDSVFYVNCSNCPTKGEFIEAIAQQFGLEKTGTYNELWREVTDKLLLVEKPLLILDEFGDVHDSIISLLKALYNKADKGDHLAVGVFHIGADNLRKKMINGRKRQKQSYAEYWSRFGEDILTLNFENPNNPNQSRTILESEASKILDMNLPDSLAKYRKEIFEKAVTKRDLRIIREQINIKKDLEIL